MFRSTIRGFIVSVRSLISLRTLACAITYCGGRILASCNAFAMTRLGFTDVALYTASLQKWAADPANAMVVGTG